MIVCKFISLPCIYGHTVYHTPFEIRKYYSKNSFKTLLRLCLYVCCCFFFSRCVFISCFVEICSVFFDDESREREKTKKVVNPGSLRLLDDNKSPNTLPLIRETFHHKFSQLRIKGKFILFLPRWLNRKENVLYKFQWIIVLNVFFSRCSIEIHKNNSRCQEIREKNR